MGHSSRAAASEASRHSVSAGHRQCVLPGLPRPLTLPPGASGSSSILSAVDRGGGFSFLLCVRGRGICRLDGLLQQRERGRSSRLNRSRAARARKTRRVQYAKREAPIMVRVPNASRRYSAERRFDRRHTTRSG